MTRPLAADAEGATVGMFLTDAQLHINGALDATTGRALHAPFRVRFALDGMPESFEFPAAVSTRNRSILENLVRSFQVTLKPADEWRAEETNGSGTYEAAYRRHGPAQLEKTKRRFLGTATGSMLWSEVDSTESIVLDSDCDWLASMEVTESLRSTGQAGPKMTVDNHSTLKLSPGEPPVHRPDLWDFEADEAAVDDLAMLKPERPALNIDATEARKRILSSISELNTAEQGRLRLVHRLRDLLLVDASLPRIILDALKTQGLTDRTRADLYLALELAGSDSAQTALVEVMNDSAWSQTDGMRAIVALGGIKDPHPTSISALWAATDTYAFDQERQRMATSAAYALGSIGQTLNRSSDPAYKALRTDLLEKAMTEGKDSTRATFITALGNTQDPTLAHEVAPMLNDDEPTVRRAAALALGTLGLDQIADKMVSRYEQEENRHVRGAIAEALRSWTQPDEDALAMFRRAVRTEVDESTRYNMAVLLSHTLSNFPENEAVLRQIMRNERSRRIRQVVANALAVHDANTN